MMTGEKPHAKCFVPTNWKTYKKAKTAHAIPTITPAQVLKVFKHSSLPYATIQDVGIQDENRNTTLWQDM